MSKSCENSIREAAYYLWQNAGSPSGQEDYFWTLAVEQYGNCSKKAKASTSSKSSTKKSTSVSAKSVSASAKKSTTTTKKSK